MRRTEQIIFLVLVFVFLAFPISAKPSRSQGKIQKLDFSDVDVTGKIRSPDGSYVVQKKGMDFGPLYKLKEKFHESVKESMEYIH